MSLKNHGMFTRAQAGLTWAISQELGMWEQRSAANIFSSGYLWESNLQSAHKGPERIDEDYVRTNKRLYPLVIRNRVRSPYRVYRHLMGMCKVNGGNHVIRYGNRRHHVNVRVARHGAGIHDVQFRQTLIKVEAMRGRGRDKDWQEVEA